MEPNKDGLLAPKAKAFEDHLRKRFDMHDEVSYLQAIIILIKVVNNTNGYID